MPSFRQYVTPQQIKVIIPAINVDSITDAVLNQAETLIDQAVAMFHDELRPYFDGHEEEFEASKALFTNATLTISDNFSFENNHFTHCVVEIIDFGETHHGLRIPVTKSVGNVIHFQAVENLSGNKTVKIYQMGKFPMDCDSFVKPSGIFKTIPYEIQQAVAYQVEYILNSPKMMNSAKAKMKSESIGTNYSYTKYGPGEFDIIRQQLAPMALSVLENSGYTAQSWT